MTAIKNSMVNDPTTPMVEAESELRAKNQITMPKLVSEVLKARAGDRFVWVVEDGERGVVHLHRLQASYAGSMAGVYGGPDEVDAYLTAERESWDE